MIVYFMQSSGYKSHINKLSKRYIDSAKNDSKMINLFLSNSDFSTFLIRRDMWYSGKILQKGLPRTDVLLNGDRNTIAKKVKSCLSINEDNKILLYAPRGKGMCIRDNL